MRYRFYALGIPAVIVSMIVLFSSCILMKSSIPTKNYYIINYPPVITASPGSQRPYPYALQVGEFKLQSIFNRQNIVYRFSPVQIQYYELEQWAVRPDQMIANLVVRHLELSGLTNRVGIDFFEIRPDFRIEGMVEAVEKYDAGDVFYAHLAMSMKLLRTSDGNQVWEYSFDQRRQVYHPEMIYTVQSLSSIFQSEMDIIVGQLDSLFLAMSTGKTLPRTPVEAAPQKPVMSDSTGVKIDESGFEIIIDKPKSK